MQTITTNKLKEILDKHKKWLCNKKGGKRADLRYADLRYTDLRYVDFSSADLRYADLRYADLSSANLSSANFSYADLDSIKIEESRKIKMFPLVCPEVGSFIGWKIAEGCIVKLEIMEDAKRSSAYGRKCRCSAARVLAIENIDGTTTDKTEVHSDRNSSFVYRVGEIVMVDDFDEDRWNECSTGIHFFITRQEAVDY